MSDGMFTLVLSLQKDLPNDLNLAKVKRVEDIDLANCFNDETKGKVPSEIKSPFNFVFVSYFRPLCCEHRSKSASEGGGGGKVWVLHRTNNSSSFPVITIMLSPNLFLMDDSALITV